MTIRCHGNGGRRRVQFTHDHTHQRLLCIAATELNSVRLQLRLYEGVQVTQQTHQTHEISGFI